MQKTCQSIAEKIKSIQKGKLSDKDVKRVQDALSNFRELSGYFAESPDNVFRNIFNRENINKLCYPCDVIELRSILNDGYINSEPAVAFLPLEFATKFFTSYSVFLVFNNNIKDCIDLKNIKVLKDHILVLKDTLLYVIVNQTYGHDAIKQVQSIVAESVYDIPVMGHNSIPGISMPDYKVASQTYIINIESMGIVNYRVNAESEIEAVEVALDRRWAQLYGNKVNRSPKFRVEYWQNTRFWDSIVKQSSVFNLTKTGQVSNEINKTQLEDSIFDVIVATKKAFNVPVDLRIAGGWVRDKLLGTESDDIDIAISHMPGYDFAKLVEQYGQNNADVGQAYRVSLEKSADPKVEEDQNPDLMVGGIPIFGQKVEFVPMRTETYQEGSRTPIIARTDNVEEDVVRRDLTINAMYYNIETGQVEDYVNGKEDLQNMYLRTPVDPVKTFTDDPLRLLRALRFYSRYSNAELDPAIIKAMQNPDIIEAYKAKVAPLRAGPELTKLLGGARPAEAVRVLFETGFYKTAFNVPEMEGLHPIEMDQQTPHHKFNLMDHTLRVLDNYNKSAIDKNLPLDRRILRNLTALFHDFGKMHPEIQKEHPKNKGQMQYIGHEDKSVLIADSIMKSIGIPEKDRKYAGKLMETHMRPHAKKWSPKSMGKMLAKLEVPGQEDKTNELLEDLWDHGKADEEASDPDTADLALKDQHYQGFLDFQNQQLQGPNAGKPLNKPLIDGRQIMSLIPELLPNSGFIKEVMDQLMSQRYSNSSMTEDDAIQFVNSIKPQIIEKYKTMQAFNLNKFKIAENDLGTGDNSGRTGFHGLEGGEDMYKQHDDMARPQEAVSPFYVGQTIRMRRRGLAFKQVPGKIIEMSPAKVKIKWEDGKEVEYPNDPVFLSFKIQKVF
tara:strand:+ start:823 stop:3498 length:2676 start_codon:yes stop_codon:yes gene_type:complete